MYFTSYEVLKERLHAWEHWGKYGCMADLTAGFGAEVVACIVFVPVDVVKERLQVQSTLTSAAQYRGSWNASRDIWRNEGLAGIYKVL